MKMLLSISLVAAFTASPAHAATVSGLFNTGTDANNVALAGNDGVADPHYRILSSTLPNVAGQQAVTFRASAYTPDDADSRWVSANSTGADGFNTTTYRTTFDLTGFDPASVVLSGQFGSDNSGFLSINGATPTFITGVFQGLTAFAFSTGFVTGLNTLDIRVENFGGPTAFRLDNLAATANVVTNGVPEPTSWAMMIAGFGLAGAAARRRRPGTPGRLSISRS